MTSIVIILTTSWILTVIQLVALLLILRALWKTDREYKRIRSILEPKPKKKSGW